MSKRQVLVVGIVIASFVLIYKIVHWYSYNQAFNKAEWADGDEGFGYPKRRYMLNDLIENHKIRGLTYKQLIDTVGQPHIDSGSNEAYYNIVLDYGWDIDPVY